jgi:hypothetical protein
VELEAGDGDRWKTKLVHSKSCEEDVRVSGHSPIKDVAQQHLVDEVKKHIYELKQAGIKVEEAPKSLWEVAEINDHMLERTFYVAHRPITLDDGIQSIMTRYWWEVVAVSVGNQGG